MEKPKSLYNTSDVIIFLITVCWALFFNWDLGDLFLGVWCASIGTVVCSYIRWTKTLKKIREMPVKGFPDQSGPVDQAIFYFAAYVMMLMLIAIYVAFLSSISEVIQADDSSQLKMFVYSGKYTK